MTASGTKTGPDHTTWIFGGSGHLGALMCARLTATSRTVVALSRTCPADATPLEATTGPLSGLSWQHFDATASPSTARSTISRTAQLAPPSHIAWLVAEPFTRAPLSEITHESWQHQMHVNGYAVAHTLALVAGVASPARVLVVGSDARRTNKPTNSPYAAARAVTRSVVENLVNEQLLGTAQVVLVEPSGGGLATRPHHRLHTTEDSYTTIPLRASW
jgi:NAD(P)-dependent dehydrogenase (short-subunit alcohol dehydrogenase family)